MEKTTRLLLDVLSCDKTQENYSIKDFSNEDWNTFIEKAKYHLVNSYIYYHLKEKEICIEDRIQRILEDGFLKLIYRNTNINLQLAEIIKSFHDQSIDLVLLKGSYLGNYIYPNIGLRFMSDIDLLVNEKDFLKAENNLYSLGYKRKSNHQRHLINEFHIPYIKDGNPCVEIHWALNELTLHKDNIKEIWGRAQPLDMEGYTVFTLSPEDNLIYLCYHTIEHMLSANLQMLLDIKQLIIKFTTILDWDSVIERAKKWNLHRAVFIVLSLSRELLKIPIPLKAITELSPVGFKKEYMDFMRNRFIDYSKLRKHYKTNLFEIVMLIRNGLQVSREKLSIIFNISEDSWKIWFYMPFLWNKIIRKRIDLFKKTFSFYEKTQYNQEIYFEALAVRNWLLSGNYSRVPIHSVKKNE